MTLDEPRSIQFDGMRATVDLAPFTSAGITILVDPATIAAVVSAALDYYKSKQVGDWQMSVSGHLQQILSKLEEIIDLIHQAVHDIIQNNNENWQDYFATNIQGPGRAWEYYDSTKKPLNDNEISELIAAFTNRLSAAVQSITISGRYNAWGFTLVDVVRIAFVYSMLALKLAHGKLSPRTVKAEVGQHVLGYLVRSTTSGPTEPMSLANALTSRTLQLTSHVALMESWCNGWVRVSDEYVSCSGGKEEKHCTTRVRIARISGGATNPTLVDTIVVDERDSRFGASYYPGFPGSIETHEDEKARYYCNDRLNSSIAKRNELSQHVAILTSLIDNIKNDIATIGEWMKS